MNTANSPPSFMQFRRRLRKDISEEQKLSLKFMHVEPMGKLDPLDKINKTYENTISTFKREKRMLLRNQGFHNSFDLTDKNSPKFRNIYSKNSQLSTPRVLSNVKKFDQIYWKIFSPQNGEMINRRTLSLSQQNPDMTNQTIDFCELSRTNDATPTKIQLKRKGKELQRHVEASYWKRRGKEYQIPDKIKDPIKYNCVINIHKLLANPEDGTLEFFTKYLRHILIANSDPFLKKKYKQYSEIMGEKRIGKDFIDRMNSDIKGREKKSRNSLTLTLKNESQKKNNLENRRKTVFGITRFRILTK